MRFGKVQQRKFGTGAGAYSTVTDREHYDSQITLTDYEAELVITHYGRGQIHVGNVGSNPKLASKPLRLFPGGEEIMLNIVFPKPEKTELRLYVSTRAGFKPTGGEIWFMFAKGGDLWIGAMPEAAWRAESSELKKDDADPIYQESLDETDNIRIAKLKERDVYARDRNVAIRRMELSEYSCEYNPKHKLFISRFSRQPYLEAHHLVPMGLQGEFRQSLDNIHNVFCLCPNCHRAVHHAEEKIARKILGALADRRAVLDGFSLTIKDLYALYAIEEII
jgi:5-methylcytosine-specific restriction protein A